MPRSRPPEQLDIPLVWELDRPPLETGENDPFPVAPEPRPAGFGRLLVAASADLGVCLLAGAVAAGIAASSGAALRPEQLVVGTLSGLIAASWVAVGSLWGWGATPGLSLLRVGMEQPPSLGRSIAFWLVWLLSLPVVGAPLLIGRRGARLAERFLGAALSSR